jgi:hypothetical protein
MVMAGVVIILVAPLFVHTMDKDQELFVPQRLVTIPILIPVALVIVLPIIELTISIQFIT